MGVEFGTSQALEYLVGGKFIDFLEASDGDAGVRAKVPAFVAEIKTIFERWQLQRYLETARESSRFDLGPFESGHRPLPDVEDVAFDAGEMEEMQRDGIRQCARDLPLVERAREWLLD
jgi:hypothetical protein